MTKLLTATEVAELFSISRVHVWRRVKAGHLPAPIYPAPKAPRWRSDEIEAMFASRGRARRGRGGSTASRRGGLLRRGRLFHHLVEREPHGIGSRVLAPRHAVLSVERADERVQAGAIVVRQPHVQLRFLAAHGGLRQACFSLAISVSPEPHVPPRGNTAC